VSTYVTLDINPYEHFCYTLSVIDGWLIFDTFHRRDCFKIELSRPGSIDNMVRRLNRLRVALENLDE
jgi:hypothetical protein